MTTSQERFLVSLNSVVHRNVHNMSPMLCVFFFLFFLFVLFLFVVDSTRGYEDDDDMMR